MLIKILNGIYEGFISNCGRNSKVRLWIITLFI